VQVLRKCTQSTQCSVYEQSHIVTNTDSDGRIFLVRRAVPLPDYDDC